jgi:hypothetical protein
MSQALSAHDAETAAGPRSAADLMEAWLRRQSAPPAMDWLLDAAARVRRTGATRELALAFSLVPRKLGKADLALGDADLTAADRIRPGWSPRGWTVDQTARLVLLLSAAGDPAPFAERLRMLAASADIGELIALYRGLPLYPEPARYVRWAAEGVRSNMKAVFEAVAHRNPYPAEQFDQAAWNQMIVKAVFIGSPLDAIQGLDRRCNPRLARMLCDFAHERWAAGRPVAPELWRCVGAHADGAALRDLARVLAAGGPAERQAAALALAENPSPEAAAVAAAAPDLRADIAAGRLSWRVIRPDT